VAQDGSRSGLAARWRLARGSLRVRLVVTTLCALAAGVLVIAGAGVLVARSYLMGQADQQLRAYAGGLASRPFAASPLYGLTPAAPSTGAPGGVFGIEIRGSDGQLVLRAVPGGGSGPLIPAVPARVPARTGQLVTVPAGHGVSWRVIAQPIHYQTRHNPFSYSAEGFSVLVTGPDRPGRAGTLVIGVDLAGPENTVGRLAVFGLAAGGVLVLIVGGLGALLIRALLRPLTQAQEALAMAAAGEFTRRVPERPGGGTGRLAQSLNTMMSRTEHDVGTRAGSETAARQSAERIGKTIADTCHQLRRPLTVIHGLARYGRPRERLSAGELDRRMKRLASEAARMEALVDDLLPAGRDQPPP
jgi:two-component system OmpR family sensor kinase